MNEWFAVALISNCNKFDQFISIVRIWHEDCLDEIMRLLPSLKSGSTIILAEKSTEIPYGDNWEYKVP